MRTIARDNLLRRERLLSATAVERGNDAAITSFSELPVSFYSIALTT